MRFWDVLRIYVETSNYHFHFLQIYFVCQELYDEAHVWTIIHLKSWKVSNTLALKFLQITYRVNVLLII